MIEVAFVEVRVPSMAGGAPIVVLRETSGRRLLPVWVTATAASGVLAAADGEQSDPDHPCVHDLLLDVLSAQDATLDEVRLVAYADGIFSAQVIVSGTASACRASDGIALALRAGVPILADEAVLDAAGVEPDAVDGFDDHASVEVEQFRQFLADVKADDFDGPPGDPEEPRPQP